MASSFPWVNWWYLAKCSRDDNGFWGEPLGYCTNWSKMIWWLLLIIKRIGRVLSSLGKSLKRLIFCANSRKSVDVFSSEKSELSTLLLDKTNHKRYSIENLPSKHVLGKRCVKARSPVAEKCTSISDTSSAPYPKLVSFFSQIIASIGCRAKRVFLKP